MTITPEQLAEWKRIADYDQRTGFDEIVLALIAEVERLRGEITYLKISLVRADNADLREI